MCYNANVSLGTYIIGMIGSIYLYTLNYIPESILYTFVIQMQLIEYFLWKNQECKKTNEITTKLGIIINHLEPIAFYIGILLFSMKTLPLFVHVMVLIYMIIIYNYINLNKINTIKCTTVNDKSKPHLYWEWNYKNMYEYVYLYFLIILVTLSIYGLENGIIQSGLICIGFIGSYIIYGNTHSVGAMWCFYSSILPWIYSYLIS